MLRMRINTLFLLQVDEYCTDRNDVIQKMHSVNIYKLRKSIQLHVHFLLSILHVCPMNKWYAIALGRTFSVDTFDSLLVAV